jgi:hypothetical protein
MGLPQPPYNTTYWRLWSSLLQRKDLHSSIIEYFPGTMNIYLTDKIRNDYQEYHDMARSYTRCWTLIVYVPLVKYVKWQRKSVRKNGMIPTKIAESDIASLGHGLCGSGGSIYNKDTSQNTLSSFTHKYRSSHWLQISQQYPSRICFITLGWHVIRDLNLFSLTMGACVCKTIMSLKPNQLLVKTNIKQANAIIERVHKVISCQWHAQINWFGKRSWKSRRTRR